MVSREAWSLTVLVLMLGFATFCDAYKLRRPDGLQVTVICTQGVSQGGFGHAFIAIDNNTSHGEFLKFHVNRLPFWKSSLSLVSYERFAAVPPRTRKVVWLDLIAGHGLPLGTIGGLQVKTLQNNFVISEDVRFFIIIPDVFGSDGDSYYRDDCCDLGPSYCSDCYTGYWFCDITKEGYWRVDKELFGWSWSVPGMLDINCHVHGLWIHHWPSNEITLYGYNGIHIQTLPLRNAYPQPNWPVNMQEFSTIPFCGREDYN